MNKISCALPPETKCQLSMYMILPIVMKCSLTAQNVFTCSAWRHVLVLYTVAIVKIFFFTVGINNNRYRCHTTLSGFFFVSVACFSRSSSLLIMTSQFFIASCQFVLQKVRCERASHEFVSEKIMLEKTPRNKLDSFAFMYVQLSNSNNSYWIQISWKREQKFLFVLKYLTFYCPKKLCIYKEVILR